jgi:DNA-binding NarL/FixJ family response regulator/EAL domain-containing protein (putative c-di-GMP-specific phosphodiesterase class I)
MARSDEEVVTMPEVTSSVATDRTLGARPIRVLVADDDRAVVDALRALVGSDPSLRFVGAATDADQAIDLVIRERPDVVLLDVQMPAGGGLRAAREISQHGLETKIVALSAHEDAETVIGMIAAGAHGYVPKGDPTAKILRTIRRVTGTWRRPHDAHHVDLRLVPPAEPIRDERAAAVARAILDNAVMVAFAPIVDLATMRITGLQVQPRVVTLPHRPYEAWCDDAHAVGLLADLELATVGHAISALRHVPDDIFLEMEVSPFTAVEARFRRILGQAVTSQIVLGFSALVAGGDVRIDGVDFADTLETWRARGIRLATTGSGSDMEGLSHLRSLRPDFVRLDETLSRSLDSSFIHHSVVSAAVSCAAQVGARVIATGVRSGDQLEELRGLGVQLAQGPRMGDPLSTTELPVDGAEWTLDPSGDRGSRPKPEGEAVPPRSSTPGREP